MQYQIYSMQYGDLELEAFKMYLLKNKEPDVQFHNMQILFSFKVM